MADGTTQCKVVPGTGENFGWSLRNVQEMRQHPDFPVALCLGEDIADGGAEALSYSGRWVTMAASCSDDGEQCLVRATWSLCVRLLENTRVKGGLS